MFVEQKNTLFVCKMIFGGFSIISEKNFRICLKPLKQAAFGFVKKLTFFLGCKSFTQYPDCAIISLNRTECDIPYVKVM